jgi:secretion/DNA translocation related TadE-like protein
MITRRGPTSAPRSASISVAQSISGDQGSGTISLLAVMLVGLLLITTLGVLGGVVLAKRRVQVAADLGALAGARWATSGASIACSRARKIVKANRARLASCELAGFEIIVTAEVALEALFGVGTTSAKARAGPAQH